MPKDNTNDKVKEMLSELEEGVKDMFSSDRYAEYLSTMSRFHNYSLNNQILIHLQNPTATYVAGYNAWEKNFDRSVNRGEKGIRILAPVTHKKTLDEIDEDTGENKVVVYTSFRPAYVFDVSQTDGKELPSITKMLDNDVSDYDRIMRVLKDVSPAPIFFEDIKSEANGYYNPGGNVISIKEGMPEEQTIKTTIHEIAHAMLHNDNSVYADVSREAKEVQAESIAYITAEHLGLDASDYSFGYITGWSSGKDTKELKESLDIIHDAAETLIKDIDERYDELKDLRTYEIYQLKDIPENRDYEFMSYNSIDKVDADRYEKVYGDVMQDDESLDTLYEKFNIDHPDDFRGRSLSVSDVVVIRDKDETRAYYTDSFGFKDITDSFIKGDDGKKDERIQTPRGNFKVIDATKDEMEKAGYGYHHSSEDGKYDVMANGTDAYAVKNEEKQKKRSHGRGM